MAAFCRDCLGDMAVPKPRCTACGSPRIVRHTQLAALTIAHVDCDAFYAAVEKRDNPALIDKPLIIGGGTRGVVATACYIARTYGVRSAMPMFEARRLCPAAVVIAPDMAKYAEAGRAVRRMMLELTPLVEPLSIDEAFLDLAGTERLHDMIPAKALARFALNVERALGITVSIGLSGNKYLAKIASDLDKPRGYAVLSQEEAPAFLALRPVSAIFGIGKAAEARLLRDGIRTVGDLQRTSEMELRRRYGAEGLRLSRLALGIDTRPVRPERETKSVSSETTFAHDLADFHALERELWRLCERVSTRMKAARLAGTTVTLKLKSADFRIRTRARSLSHATQLATRIFAAGRDLLKHEAEGTPYRLIGIGLSHLQDATGSETDDLLDRRAAIAEEAVDRLRHRYGRDAVVRGLVFEARRPRGPKG